MYLKEIKNMKNKSLLFIRIALIAVLIFLLTAFISKQFAQISVKDKSNVKKVLIEKIRVTKDTVISLQDSIENAQIRKLDSIESAEIDTQRDKIEKVKLEINKSEIFDSTEKSAFNDIIDKTPEAVEQVKNIAEKVKEGKKNGRDFNWLLSIILSLTSLLTMLAVLAKSFITIGKFLNRLFHFTGFNKLMDNHRGMQDGEKGNYKRIFVKEGQTVVIKDEFGDVEMN